jgi:hypothetical protein
MTETAQPAETGMLPQPLKSLSQLLIDNHQA